MQITHPALWLVTALAPLPAQADETAIACNQAGLTPSVQVVYTDPLVGEDSSKTLATLKTLSGSSLDRSHHVYGLTHAEPRLDYELKATMFTMPGGKVCMVPEVLIKAGFTVMQIYLANELRDSCRKQVVREHELEHVSAWKTHFRAGTKLMENPLRQAFSQPRHYDSRNQAEQELRRWARDVITPLEQRLMENLASAQRAIDSPFSYRNVENRLRSCP